jgi:predicted dehydrogenase
MAGGWSRRDAIRATAGWISFPMVEAIAVQVPGLRLPKAVRVGIIGLEGHISEIIEIARQVPQVKIVAVAEDDPDLASNAARSEPIKSARLHANYHQMLDQERLDVVAVCGRNDTRAAIVQACAERKLAVIAEKPLALSLEDLAATRRKIEANAVALSMLLPMRFSPIYQMMRSVVAGGRIGEVITMAAQKSYKMGTRPDWMKSRSSFGGTIPYIGIHMIDLMRWVSGRDFEQVMAFQSNIGLSGYGEMETNAALIFQMNNRGTASLRLDYLRPEAAPTHGDDRLRVVGTKGIIEYQDGHDVVLLTATEKPLILKELPAPRSLFADFLDAVFNGKKHLITPEEIYRVNEIVLKARGAADYGRVVKL